MALSGQLEAYLIVREDVSRKEASRHSRFWRSGTGFRRLVWSTARSVTPPTHKMTSQIGKSTHLDLWEP